MTRLIALAALLITTVSPAFAQDDAAARRAVAERVVAITTTDAAVEAMISAVWPPVRDNIVSQNADVDEATLEALRTVMADITRELTVEMSGDVVAFYADEFTADELEALEQFYLSPVGDKLLEVTPKLMTQVMPGMLTKMQQMGPRMMDAIREAAEERGLKIDV